MSIFTKIKSKYFLVLFLLIFSSIAFAQANDEKILWDKPLTWSDFKGKIDASSPLAASTRSGFSYKYSYTMKNGKASVQYTIESYFFPSQSWVKEDKKADILLRHEQVHFDITEFYARQFRKYLSENQFSPQNVQSMVTQGEKEFAKRRQQAQDKFDLETNHGKNAEKEAEWEDRIHEELKSLEKYRSTTNS